MFKQQAQKYSYKISGGEERSFQVLPVIYGVTQIHGLW